MEDENLSDLEDLAEEEEVEMEATVRAGSLAGMLLLIGLAGVACLGLFVLRGTAEPVADPGQADERLIALIREHGKWVDPDPISPRG